MVVYLIADKYKSVVMVLIVNVRRVDKLAVGDEISNILGAIHTEFFRFAVNLFQRFVCQPKLDSFCFLLHELTSSFLDLFFLWGF